MTEPVDLDSGSGETLTQERVSSIAERSYLQGRGESVQESVHAFEGELAPFPAVPHLVHAGIDYLDKFPGGIGFETKFTGEAAASLNSYLIPGDIKKEILWETDTIPTGSYLFRYRAGNTPETHHPHDFYVFKVGERKVEFYFVDPEKTIAERSGRPNVTNLVGLSLDPESRNDSFFVTRIFSGEIPHSDLKMRLQLDVARGNFKATKCGI